MYLPDDLARAIDGGGGIESKEAPRKTPSASSTFAQRLVALPPQNLDHILLPTGTLSWTAVMPAFLNHHFTCIDAEGDAHVYVLPKNPPSSSPEASPSSPSSPAQSVPESFSRAFLARCAFQT